MDACVWNVEGKDERWWANVAYVRTALRSQPHHVLRHFCIFTGQWLLVTCQQPGEAQQRKEQIETPLCKHWRKTGIACCARPHQSCSQEAGTCLLLFTLYFCLCCPRVHKCSGNFISVLRELNEWKGHLWGFVWFSGSSEVLAKAEGISESKVSQQRTPKKPVF